MNNNLAQHLSEIADLLRSNNVPQELINMVLVSRAGLPMKSIDLTSPAHPWVEDNAPQTTEQNAEVESSEERFRRLCNAVLEAMKEAAFPEGLNVLASAAGRLAGEHGYTARIAIHRLVENEKVAANG